MPSTKTRKSLNRKQFHPTLPLNPCTRMIPAICIAARLSVIYGERAFIAERPSVRRPDVTEKYYFMPPPPRGAY